MWYVSFYFNVWHIIIISAAQQSVFLDSLESFDVVNPPSRLCQMCIPHHTLHPIGMPSYHVEFLLLQRRTDNTSHKKTCLCRRGSCMVSSLCNHLLLLTRIRTLLVMGRNFRLGSGWLAEKNIRKKYVFSSTRKKYTHKVK